MHVFFTIAKIFTNNNSILSIKKKSITHVFIVVYRINRYISSILLGELFCLYKTLTPVAPVSKWLRGYPPSQICVSLNVMKRSKAKHKGLSTYRKNDLISWMVFRPDWLLSRMLGHEFRLNKISSHTQYGKSVLYIRTGNW